MIAKALVAIGAAVLAYGWQYPDPGEPKQGRIVIDDSHSFEWEQAARRLDETYFGDFSTYSYSTLSEHLSRCYSVLVATRPGSLQEALKACDVLVLKTPEVDYSEEEIAAIQGFVRGGGGLIAVGDHTNLFGLNVRLNAVIGKMGFLLRDDSVRSAHDNYFVVADAPLFGRHPAVAWTRRFMFMTGCSVWSDRPSSIVLAAQNAIADPADYVNGSAFPSWSNDPNGPAGVVGVMGAGAWGMGRVVVITDGTPFSSFEYYKRGYPEALLSSVSWANRRNGRPWVRWLLLALGIGLMVVSAAVQGAKSFLSSHSIAALTVGVYAGMAMVTVSARSYYPLDKEFACPPEVAFIDRGCYAVYPPSLGSPGGVDEEAVFDTLFNVPLRLGRRSRILEDIGGLEGSGATTAVFVNLVDPMVRANAERLSRWVSNGGRLILLQRSMLYRSNGFHALASDFGIGLELNSDNTPRMTGTERCSEAPNVIAGVRKVGRGEVLVAVNDDVFCNRSLGHSMGIPTERQQELFRFLYWAFRYDGPRWDLCRVMR